MAGFYSARSSIMPPLPWPTFAPPFSTEAEIRSILEQAARPEGRLKLGTLLNSIAREAGGLTDAEAEHFNQLRGKTPVEPVSFE